MTTPPDTAPSPAAEVQVRRYVVVFVALACLTLVTVGVSRLHLARPLAITLGLSIAVVKGGMVAAVFMHLASERKIIVALLVLTAILFSSVLLLPVLTSPGGLGSGS